MTLRGPRTFGHLRSAIVPVADLICLVAGLVSLGFGYLALAAAFWLLALVPATIRASMMFRRQLRRGVVGAAQALAVAVVFDLARALALLARGSHRARRAA